MIYADNMQIYCLFKHSCIESSLLAVHKCLNDVKKWSNNNFLLLNEKKTQVIHVSSRFRQTECPSVLLDGHELRPVDSVRNLGTICDKNLLMVEQVSKVCRAASFALYKIGQIRRYLNEKLTERLVHSLVMCHIDNCNALLYNLPETQLNRIQKIQNSAARLVTRSSSNESIIPILKKLHWLPVRARIEFKILVLTFKCLRGLAPSYLTELLTQYVPSRTLRSSQKSLLTSTQINTKFYGSRAFQVASAELWNGLPENIKNCETIDSFKSYLKTYLFRTNFHC